MKNLKQITLTILTLFTVLALVACGEAAKAQQATKITITAHDYSYHAPAQVKAGLVSITLENEGQEPHHVQLARLNDGVSVQQFQAALQQSPEAALSLVTWAGGPGVIDFGGSQEVTMELVAGTYMLLCFIPSPDGVPHLAKGMVASLEVVDDDNSSGVQPPQAEAAVEMDDFSFVLPSEIKAGPQVWQIDNEGQQPHEISLIKLAEGKTMEDVAAFMAGPNGPPPFTSAGGLQGIDPGESGWLKLNLTPGEYVALCHIPDPASGKPHTELGMVAAFSVE
jgi:uncharacterized cupredoxin-like copper-binding protein